MVGYLALHKLLVRRWKAGWGDPVVEFNLAVVKVFIIVIIVSIIFIKIPDPSLS